MSFLCKAADVFRLPKTKSSEVGEPTFFFFARGRSMLVSKKVKAGLGLGRGLLVHARKLCGGVDWSQLRPDDVERDPWLVLGVEPDASKADVKAAFRSQARSCHPDMAPDLDPAVGRERFAMVQRAFELLEHPAARRLKLAQSFDERACFPLDFPPSDSDRRLSFLLTTHSIFTLSTFSFIRALSGSWCSFDP
jgi:hypothetical protein